MRLLFAIAFALVLSCTQRAAACRPADQLTDSTWRDHRRAMTAALAAHDTATYRGQLHRLQQLVGTTPRMAGGFAQLAFSQHDTADGIRWLTRLAAMGVEFDTAAVAELLAPAREPTLGSLNAIHRAAARVVDRSRRVWQLPDSDAIAEDLAYDSARRRWLVSSVHRGTIDAIDVRGNVTRFIDAGAVGAWGVFAIGIDTRRRTLWATTAAFPGTARYTAADSGRSALLELDLVSGALRRRFSPPDAGAHALGDLTLASDGTLFLSDGFGGGIYTLAPGDSALRVVVPAGTFSSPQTPALSADGRTLFVPDYTFGIAAIDLRSGRLQWLKHPDALALSGIDGFYRVGARFIAVQNGVTPNRIVELQIAGGRVTRAAPIVRGGSGVDLNHALPVGGQLYFIARSGWDRVAPDGTMTPAAMRIEIRRTSLASPR